MAKLRILFPLLLLLVFCLIFASCGEDETTITTTPPSVTTSAPTEESSKTTTTAEITTTAVITTEDPFLVGTPGLTFESGNDGTAKVVGIIDKSATTIKIPRITPDGDRVIEIAYGAFMQNTVVESILLPPTVYKISTSAFYGCTALKSVYFSEGLETIGALAFQNCTALESLSLPASLRTLEEMAFAGCQGLRYLTVSEKNPYFIAESNCLIKKGERTLLLGCVGSKIPKDITAIADFAFYGMGLSELLMPDSVKTVGNQAFAMNETLVDLVLSESLTTLGTAAFYGCSSLKSVYLPASLTTLGTTPFRDCSAINRFVVSADNPSYYAKDLCLVEKATNTLIQGFVGAVIPETVTAIGDHAFMLLPIYTVVIPEGVTSIGKQAFAYCDALASLTLPKTLASIAPDAFRNSQVIATITFGGDKHAFDVLTAEVELPETAVVTYGE